MLVAADHAVHVSCLRKEGDPAAAACLRRMKSRDVEVVVAQMPRCERADSGYVTQRVDRRHWWKLVLALGACEECAKLENFGDVSHTDKARSSGVTLSLIALTVSGRAPHKKAAIHPRWHRPRAAMWAVGR